MAPLVVVRSDRAGYNEIVTKSASYTGVAALCVLSFAVLHAAGARGVGWTVVFVVLIAIAIVGYTLGLREWRRERHTGRQRPTR